MHGPGYVAALLLAAVFAAAGWSKARRPASTERAFRDLGLPVPRALATVVPALEGALAAGLVVVPGVAAAGALALLAGFTVVVARTMRSGREVGCGCFGSTRTDPVSFVEVVRNGLLAGLALAALAAPSPTVPDLEDVVAVVTAAAVGVLVLALCDLRRATGRVLATDPPGPAAP